MNWETVYIGFGSNLGDRLTHLRRAVVGLHAIGTVIGLSSVYETAPVGGPPQGAFLNAVAVVDTVATGSSASTTCNQLLEGA